MDITIRDEKEADRRIVEEITREAFWDLHVPGCDEHYLAHVMRDHPDFLPGLDLVAVLGGRIIGNIMYARSRVTDENGAHVETITFGPVSVLPEYQRKGVGSALIRHSIEKAAGQGFKAIIIQGYPHDYCRHGFSGSRKYNVGDAEGRYPYSLLVLELEKGLFNDRSWRFHPSPVYELDPVKAEEFDRLFPPRAKEYRSSQEEFRIACGAFVE